MFAFINSYLKNTKLGRCINISIYEEGNYSFENIAVTNEGEIYPNRLDIATIFQRLFLYIFYLLVVTFHLLVLIQ